MKNLLVPLLSTGLVVLSCVNPIDRQPVQWHSIFDLPIANKQYFFGNVIKENSDSTTAILGLNDSTTPLKFSFSDTASVSISENLYSFSPVTFKRNVGKITITTTDTVFSNFNIDSLVAGSIPRSIPIPVDVQLPPTSMNVTIRGVHRVIFDSTCPSLPVIVKNTSAGVTLKNDTVTVSDHGTVIFRDILDSLAPGADTTISNPVQGQSMDSLITITIRATIKGGISVVLNPGDGLYVGYCLNNMTIAHAEVDDTLAVINNRYTQPLQLSDTINIGYLDISSASIDVSIANGVDASFNVVSQMLNLWDESLCQQHSVFNYSSIGQLGIDSTRASRHNLDTVIVAPNVTTDIAVSGQTLQNTRLLPMWDAVQAGSLTVHR